MNRSVWNCLEVKTWQKWGWGRGQTEMGNKPWASSFSESKLNALFLFKHREIWCKYRRMLTHQILTLDNFLCFYLNKSLIALIIREGNGTQLQYFCLKNPMDGGAWWAAVYGVAQSQTRLKLLSSSSSSYYMPSTDWNTQLILTQFIINFLCMFEEFNI